MEKNIVQIIKKVIESEGAILQSIGHINQRPVIIFFRLEISRVKKARDIGQIAISTLRIIEN